MKTVDTRRDPKGNAPPPKVTIIDPNGAKDVVDDTFFQNESASMLAQAQEVELYRRNKMDILKRDLAVQNRLLRLTAFVPDLILKDDGSKVPYQLTFEGVAVVADVSGFTALTEAYSLKGRGGTDQLTKTLSTYFGPLVECFLRAGGDIIKYAGDALLAVWKVDKVSKYPTELQKVIDCALFIQERHGSLHCADVNITVKVKLGIGTGQMFTCGIGSENYKHWVVFGPGIEAASSAEHRCVATEIVVSPQAWTHCNPQHFKYIEKEDGYYRVTDITNFINKEKRGRPLAGVLIFGNKEATSATFEDCLRPGVKLAKETKTETSLRTYVIPPVFKKLNDDIPLEYLNESRQVCICFIHMDVTPFENVEKSWEIMGTIVQKAFLKIYTQVTKLQGCLTKVIMFDKGLTYLIVFGLPGYINENQSAHGLKFSYKIRAALFSIKYVTEVSIGVTTGACYCGVLGHPQRQEYTVLGRKVNKAARLMCNYPNALTCDQDTMYHSKLPQYNFFVMEAKVLKGITNVGKIYEYRDSERGEDHSVPWYSYPILGRDAELQFIREILGGAKTEYETHTKTTVGVEAAVTKEIIALGTWIVVFEGENGIGKTRMLAACMQLAENINIRVFSIGMNVILSEQQLAGITSLLIPTFRMEGLNTAAEREEHLRKHINDRDMISNLCLINGLLQTKFPIQPEYKNMQPTAQRLRSQLFIVKLIEKFIPRDLILYVIDDAHLMDSTSWEYLNYLARLPKVIVVCSIRKNSSGSPKLSEIATKIIYHGRNVKVLPLQGLHPQWCLPLVCQLTEVRSIPVDLEHLLIIRSKGVPAWCDQVMKQLVQNGTLLVVPYKSGSYGRTEMRSVDQKYLIKNLNLRLKGNVKANLVSKGDADSLSPSITSNLQVPATSNISNTSNLQISRSYAEETNPSYRMVVVKPDTNLANIAVSGTIKEILLDSYDELTSNEQMLMKCASILGLKFSRSMLIRILPVFDQNAHKFELSFRHLLENRHFRCAMLSIMSKPSENTGPPECACRLTKDEAMEVSLSQWDNAKAKTGQSTAGKRPAYYNCKFMEFVKDDMMDVVYDCMTFDQRKKLHLNAAKYLDSSTVCCPSCGGKDLASAFGITQPTAEIGAGEIEQAFRMAATKRKHDSRRKNDYKNNKSLVELRRMKAKNTIASMEVTGGNSKKASVLTQVEKIKKTIMNSGPQMARIELYIFKVILELEREKTRSAFWSTKDHQKMLEKNAQLGKEVEKEVDAEVNKYYDEDVAEKRTQISTNKVKSQTVENNSEKGGGDTTEEQRHSSMGNIVDLRTCDCAFAQAKVCLEMVRHYRFAEKYGKCLESILESAETIINIGNAQQALLHLEDAEGLLTGVKNKELPRPDQNDPNDIIIDENDARLRIEFLNGLAYYENGEYSKATHVFAKTLARLGLKLPLKEKKAHHPLLAGAQFKLWFTRYCCNFNRRHDEAVGTNSVDGWALKLRILSYMHELFKNDRKMKLTKLVTMWQVTVAEKYGNKVLDLIPAYCNMMVVFSLLCEHKKVLKYEKLALGIIRSAFGTDDQVETVGLITTAHLFCTLSSIRLNRGDISSSIDAGYLTFQISETIHDNLISVLILPIMVHGLLLNLRIIDVTECLRRLWFISEEEEELGAFTVYYVLCLDLLLDTSYAVEPFPKVLNFVSSTDWTTESTNNIFKDHELLYHLEAGIALWYTRCSKWESSQLWMAKADQHKSKKTSYVSVSAELKMLECHLILLNHHLQNKKYQHFDKSKLMAKEIMFTLDKTVQVVPVLKPRLLHLNAYYCKMRARNEDAAECLRKADKLAKKLGNELESSWITHNKRMWAEQEITGENTYWVEHTDTFDRYSSDTPGTNIMYTLPLPSWTLKE